MTDGLLRFPQRREEERRRRIVERSMRDASRWLDAGFTGAVPLAVAVAEAHLALIAAERETTKAAMA